jgi:hypothetical protein
MPKFAESDRVKAVRVTTFGVMAPEKYNVGRFGTIVQVHVMGKESYYSVEFAGSEGYHNIDIIDEVCLEAARL